MRRKTIVMFLVWLLLIFSFNTRFSAQTTVDPELAADIAQIKAIDNHAHPLRVVGRGETDEEYDALPIEGLEPSPLPLRLRPDNPEYIGAWRALYGYAHHDMSQPHVRQVLEAKRRIMRQQGDAYPAWVLDRLGIEMMLANRVAMGRGLAASRFRWVPFVDALMFPLNNDRGRKANPDRDLFYASEEQLLRRYLVESKVSALPGTLDEYLTRVVRATLERQKLEGALAVKFEAAYLRSLDFAAVSESEARGIYARYVKGGAPPGRAYKALQDFLFRFIARQAGRLGLVVQLHVSLGGGGYFQMSGAHPLLLESVFNDPWLRKTEFVIVHGGWPFTNEVTALLSKPNVYADFSAQTVLTTARALSNVLRPWLEFVPEKILFGTDAFALTPETGWEESGWLAVTTARQALALALSDMMRDGEMTRERALQLARMVLRENAIKLYDLKMDR